VIPQLEGHINDTQVNAILNVIRNQYREYLRLTGSHEFIRLFADEYAPHNRQFGVSWAISSAFPSGMVINNELYVTRLEYGRGHTRPIISNGSIELHILNKTTDFEADYLKERYLFNLNGFAGEKLFAYIKFGVEKRQLVDVRLCLPDENGIVIAEEMLMDRQTILNWAA
jgi:hypothetical protein